MIESCEKAKFFNTQVYITQFENLHLHINIFSTIPSTQLTGYSWTCHWLRSVWLVIIYSPIQGASQFQCIIINPRWLFFQVLLRWFFSGCSGLLHVHITLLIFPFLFYSPPFWNSSSRCRTILFLMPWRLTSETRWLRSPNFVGSIFANKTRRWNL